MSTLSKTLTLMRDREDIFAAAQNLGWKRRQNVAIPVDYHEKTQPMEAIQRGKIAIGVNADCRLVCDTWRLSRNGVSFAKVVTNLSQEYARLRLQRECQRAGFTWLPQSQQADGALRIVIRRAV